MDIKHLINTKTVIHCQTAKLAKDFLSDCESFGIRWRSGRKATESLWVYSYAEYGENTCFDLSTGELVYGSLSRYQELGYNILRYEECKDSEILLGEFSIKTLVNFTAEKISNYCKQNSIDDLLVVCVLDGALYFTADLTRGIDCSQELRTVTCKSYENNYASDNFKFVGDSTGVEGRTVLIIDDVYDTGRTMNFLVNKYKEWGAKEVLSCVFIDKVYMHPDTQPVNFVGYSMTEPGFLVGYGLDDLGYRRNLKSVRMIKQS